jgi:hypothetical protein
LERNYQVQTVEKNKACFEAKAAPQKKSLLFHFEVVNLLKTQLIPEKTANTNKGEEESQVFLLY